MKLVSWAMVALCISMNASMASASDGCDFRVAEGTGLITSIETAPDNHYNCGKDAVEITFEFFADNPSEDVSDSRKFGTISFGDGMNPSRKWLEDNKLVIGSKIRVEKWINRYFYPDVDAKICGPVNFSYPDLSMDGRAYNCWEN